MFKFKEKSVLTEKMWNSSIFTFLSFTCESRTLFQLFFATVLKFG